MTLLGAGAAILARPLLRGLWPEAVEAQEQAPNHRDVTLTARNYAFTPDRLEVTRDDVVKITVSSADQTHSFAIDEYRIVKRIPAGGTTTFEFRADRPGTFAFYCNIATDPGCRAMRGTLVVRPK